MYMHVRGARERNVTYSGLYREELFHLNHSYCKTSILQQHTNSVVYSHNIDPTILCTMSCFVAGSRRIS